MRKVDGLTRVSKFFGLTRDQTTLDFLDVPIGADMPAFLDPSRIRGMECTWATECTSLLQHFFQRLLQHVVADDKAAGLQLLEGLSERNEFHLGLSKGKSQGSGIGRAYAKDFWSALGRSSAGKSGLLQDLEDACLFIEGVGPDRISDATCNILRGPLIRYTLDMCAYYGIKTEPNIESGPIWNIQTDRWDDSLIDLPVTPFGPLLLVPKIAVRHRMIYDSRSYYTHYLLPSMQTHEKTINSGLVEVLRDGRKRVTKTSLRKHYGADKLQIAGQSVRHPDVLHRYRREAVRTSQPMTHIQLAELENIDIPRFDRLLKDVVDIDTGREQAGAYENAIEALLTALFFPSLSFPKKQHEIHDGRKRIDITYVNTASSGFFQWLSSNYSAAHIFIECKNYGKEVGNPEIDQLAGRFSPSRGQLGILVCRAIEDQNRLTMRCVDTAKDNRGYILHLTDTDLAALVGSYISTNGSAEYVLLRSKFSTLIM